MKIKTALFGIRGYSASELLKLINTHPALELHALFSRRESLPALQDELAGKVVYAMEDELPDCMADVDICFLATPHAVSAELAPKLVARGKTVIDLSPAFRLPPSLAKQAYGQTFPELAASYNLSPWCAASIKDSALIANPGCYATCALMSLIPLLQADIILSDPIIIDAKSGASGAGRQAREELLFCEIADNFTAYKVGNHQHIPEINHYLNKWSDKTCNVLLFTQIIPLVRGIAMTIYARARTANIQHIAEAYHRAYKNYPLVLAKKTSSGSMLLKLKSVIHTARQHISYHIDKEHLVIFACIDNLLKGAASQAIEAANIYLGLPPEFGLEVHDGK